MTPLRIPSFFIRCLLSIYFRARGWEHRHERHGPAPEDSAVWRRRWAMSADDYSRRGKSSACKGLLRMGSGAWSVLGRILAVAPKWPDREERRAGKCRSREFRCEQPPLPVPDWKLGEDRVRPLHFSPSKPPTPTPRPSVDGHGQASQATVPSKSGPILRGHAWDGEGVRCRSGAVVGMWGRRIPAVQTVILRPHQRGPSKQALSLDLPCLPHPCPLALYLQGDFREAGGG